MSMGRFSILRAAGAALFITATALNPGCGSGETPGTGGAGGTGGTGGAGAGGTVDPPEEVQGCTAEVKLLAVPEDPSERGPWTVGAKTVQLGQLRVEIVYPAEPGSQAGKETVSYDLRDWLPVSEKSKIPDEDTVLQPSGVYRDLPVDGAHGPYPVVVYSHGSYGFRTEALSRMEHWASRGFVVASADLPGLTIGDNLQGTFVYNTIQDASLLLSALAAPAGEMGFLAGLVDSKRRAFAGRQQSGAAAMYLGSIPDVLVNISLAYGCQITPDQGAAVQSTLVMGALGDQFNPYDPYVKKCYGYASPTRRVVGLANTTRVFFSDYCWLVNKDGQGFGAVAQSHGVTGVGGPNDLALSIPCSPVLPEETSRSLLSYTTTAALEEKLSCKPGNPFDGIQAKYADISDFAEEL